MNTSSDQEMPLLVLPLFRFAGLPQNHFIDMLIITGGVVSSMVYVVMPRYTRLIKDWLFK